MHVLVACIRVIRYRLWCPQCNLWVREIRAITWQSWKVVYEGFSHSLCKNVQQWMDCVTRVKETVLKGFFARKIWLGNVNLNEELQSNINQLLTTKEDSLQIKSIYFSYWFYGRMECIMKTLIDEWLLMKYEVFKTIYQLPKFTKYSVSFWRSVTLIHFTEHGYLLLLDLQNKNVHFAAFAMLQLVPNHFIIPIIIFVQKYVNIIFDDQHQLKKNL